MPATQKILRLRKKGKKSVTSFLKQNENVLQIGDLKNVENTDPIFCSATNLESEKN